MVLDALDGGRGVVPADQANNTVDAANAASTKTSDSFTVQKSGLNVVANGVYPFSFAYLYEDPDNPSQQIPGPRSPNFLFTLQTPDLTQPVTNLVVTPGLLSYGVKWDLIDKALPANKWLIDIQIYESLTGAFTGEEYLVWNGNGNSATILVSNTANRWIRVDTRDQDYRKKSVISGPFKATDPIVVDTTGPANVTSVTATSGIDTSGYLGFNAFANISWPAVTGGGIRGYRIRFSNDNGATYSYVDSPGTGTTYKLAGLAIGSTYQIAVATYDEYNNTSSSYISGPNINVTGTPSVSNYISGGPFQFGVGVGNVSTNKGLYFDASNYWYINAANSARLKVGGATSNYLQWDGSVFAVDGNITARGGTFSGNIFMSTSGASIYNGTIDSVTGNLTGNGFALNSTGLKVANGTKSVTISAATGTITANGGSIGNWNITDTTLSKNNIILDSAGVIQVGASAAASVYLSSSGSFVMWAGNNTPDANAKFRVGSDGTLYATNAVLGSGTTVAGYATTGSLANYALTSALAAYATTTALAGVKATADAALPSTNFSKLEVLKKLNNSTNGATLNGGILEAGTVVADNVVSTYVYAGYIDAEKIKVGTLSGQRLIAGATGTSYYLDTRGNKAGVDCLVVNGIGIESTTTGGVLTHWYPYYGGSPNIDLGTTLYRWNDVRISGSVMVGHNGTDTIGLASGPKTRLYPSGNIYANTLGTSTTVPASGSTIIQDSSGYLRVYVSASSQKYKENIISYPTQGMDDLIKGMRPVTFNYKADFSDRPDEVHLGLIAEEVHDLQPNNGLVKYKDDEPDSIAYEKIPMFLVGAFKEMSNKIDLLQSRLDALEG
jgi:hypothetical protein